MRKWFVILTLAYVTAYCVLRVAWTERWPKTAGNT